MRLSPHGTDSKTIFPTTEAQSAQSEISFLPDGERVIGQKIAVLRTQFGNRLVSCWGLDIYQRAFFEGGGSFTWPSSPGQVKNFSPLWPLCLCGSFFPFEPIKGYYQAVKPPSTTSSIPVT